MNKVKELTEEIQNLENDYAEILAMGGNAGTLNFIWNQIKDLRSQLSASIPDMTKPGFTTPSSN